MPDTKPAPAIARSYWNATAPVPDFPKLGGKITADLAIIGGGIVGITTARAAKDLGLTVAVVEARRVGRQVTGKSTAKVTSQHRLIYRTLKRKFGEDRARLYAEAQEAGLRKIQSLTEQHAIDCDLEPRAAYVYTCGEAYLGQIEEEVEVARSFGLPASFVRETGLPFEVLGAIRFDDQAQFHPTKYVAGLARTIPGDGCHVFEGSRVIDWDSTRIETEHGSVAARHVVMATNLPLGKVGGFYAEARPHAEPMVVAPLGRVPDGMYISAEHPSHSIRVHRRNGETFGIAAGPGFTPGDTVEERKSFSEIERWLIETFAAGPVAYRWVNEDYSSVDGAPFVGWSSSKSDAYLVATGFGAWGITNGTAAGMIIADLAAGRPNRWLEMFDASRSIKPVGKKAGGAAHGASGHVSPKPKSLDALGRGEAAVLEIEGESVAAFRDEQGEVHALSAACSHMGCLVGWNETDRTWDCPCHGSRFELSGEVLHGPATSPLTPKTQAGRKQSQA
jgi:glycine/D-amino acid oxidase-like deaminating enzyme/nitrite reductase/ring-hydroxylating ferredoxin subunit